MVICTGLEQDKNTASTLSLRAGDTTEVAFTVPVDLWGKAEQWQREFTDKVVSKREGQDLGESALALLFMDFCHNLFKLRGADNDAVRLIQLIFTTLHQKHFKGQGPFIVPDPPALEGLEKSEVLRIYYEARNLLMKRQLLEEGEEEEKVGSALFRKARAGDNRLLGVFGGQGNTENLLSELVEMNRAFGSIIRPFILDVLADMPPVLEGNFRDGEYSLHGFRVLTWIEHPELRPPPEYLLSGPISMPLIGLIQLCHYYLLNRLLGVSLSDLQASFVHVTGHSQGIIPAAVISISQTEEQLIINAQRALKLLFCIGVRCMKPFASSSLTLPDNTKVTPMLSITNLNIDTLLKQLEAVNSLFSSGEKVYLALKNGPRAVVCAGPPKSLCGLYSALARIRAHPDEDQIKIPFADRKLHFNMRFLPIDCPFHSDYLAKAIPQIMADVESFGLSFIGGAVSMPMLDPAKGGLLTCDGNLLRRLVEHICIETVDWSGAIQARRYTHIIDFGPGRDSGIGALTSRNVEGRGVQVLFAGLWEGRTASIGLSALLSPDTTVHASNWEADFGPGLVQNDADGQLYVKTRFSSLLGKQPVMVAGMTPTTANERFVAACINAGYHVELAGGGCHTEAITREKVMAIFQAIPPGCGLTVNLLFINQRLWSFQFPLLLRLREEGYNIEGITVAAGVPSLEVANGIVAAMKKSGMRHISFKPGSVDGILQVCTIAQHNPDFPIIMQWTGGRAGGHHSYEDFHEPILETYSRIRAHGNIILVGGSGFGDGEGSWPYLTGEWSKILGHAAMPFDAILFGSRMLVAAEANTSKSAKQLICDIGGVECESEWVKTYSQPAGGIVTVVSEMGEPIHKIATRCVIFWKELDETVFKLPLGKRAEYVRQHKSRIIQRLNRDAHKVWFGRSSADGSAVDLHQMTYREVISRLAELLYLKKYRQWISPTYQELFMEFVGRSWERCVSQTAEPAFDRELNPVPIDPLEMINKLAPLDLDVLISPEDVKYFLLICQNPVRKPVPFIPILDGNFENWFKKDSLWQSEFVEAVMDEDPQRTCILQGPVAVKYSKTVDQPVKDILKDIVDHYVERLKAQNVALPRVPWLNCDDGELILERAGSLEGEEVQVDEEFADMPIAELALRLAKGRQSWLSGLFLSPHIVQGRRITENRIPSFFKLSVGQVIKRRFSPDGDLQGLSIHSKEGDELLSVHYTTPTIELKVVYYSSARPSTLLFTYSFRPQTPNLPLFETVEHRIFNVKKFYWDLWGLDSDEEALERVSEMSALDATFRDKGKMGGFDEFYQSISQKASSFQGGSKLPLDYAMVLAWKPVLKCLFVGEINGDLLQLVHLSNHLVRKTNDAISQGSDAIISSCARIMSITLTSSGKVVKVMANLYCGEALELQVISEFLFRGVFGKDDLYFERTIIDDCQLGINSPEAWKMLLAKPWITWSEEQEQEDDARLNGSPVKVTVESIAILEPRRNWIKELKCTGDVWLGPNRTRVGKISFEANEVLVANPVLTYIEQNMVEQDPSVLLEQPIAEGGDEVMVISALPSSEAYSKASGDTNPIHTDPRFALFSALPGCIKHGMWTSAAVRCQIEDFYQSHSGGDPRMIEWKASFEHFVLTSDKISTKVWHHGMKAGYRLLTFQSTNDEGTVVMKGTAKVEEPNTAFVFTGQGSQEVGMGMDLYEASPVAREIWDRAERHFYEKYGFSILWIIRENPKSLTIHFRGRRGQSIKENYLALRSDFLNKDDDREGAPVLFGEITRDSSSYTFSSPEGLLSSTQFTQPALTLMEKAAYEDMVSKGLVSSNSLFAGHSLGEYAALAAVGNVLSVETLCDIVFYRGLTMQLAVPRDSAGKSSFAMIAVNPSRVASHFSETSLKSLVDLVGSTSGWLLEIVNYNVGNWQYVVAGHLIALDSLALTLDQIARAQVRMEDGSIAELEGYIKKALEKVQRKYQLEGHLTLSRGMATIPLAGIDVPFHSSFLKKGVASFRKCLEARIPSNSVDPNILCDKYIPNLTGRPFKLSREYLESIASKCDSPIIHRLRDAWDDQNFNEQTKLYLARTILIELLAYQFASPVLWIQTQDVLLHDLDVQRIIEIGPSAVLAGMVEKTIELKYQFQDEILSKQRQVWSYQRNKSSIYHENFSKKAELKTSKAHVGMEVKAVGGAGANDSLDSNRPTINRPSVSKRLPPSTIEALPLSLEDTVRIIVAIKAKRPLDQVKGDMSIKSLSGGKSTLQNEIIADLQREFGDLPDRPEEMSIRELSNCIKKPSNALGGWTQATVAKLFASKLPPSFGEVQARDFLKSRYGLDRGALDQMLIFCLAWEPKERISNQQQAEGWISKIVKDLLSSHNLQIPESNQEGEVGPTHSLISSAELESIELNCKKVFKKQIEALQSFLNDREATTDGNNADMARQNLEGLQAELDLWTAEYGSEMSEMLKPKFASLKVRQYDSCWNWSRQDLFEFSRTREPCSEGFKHSQRNRSTPELIDMVEFCVKNCSEQDSHRFDSLLESVKQGLAKPPLYKETSPITQPALQISHDGKVLYSEIPREGVSNHAQYVERMKTIYQGKPLLNIKSGLNVCEQRTELYFGCLAEIADEGVSFEDITALVTGCGKGSIGYEIAKRLLSGGAKVIVTTSSYSQETVNLYRSMYEESGGKHSKLIIVPFNQGSTRDITGLLGFIYDRKKGLGWDLDCVFPFAAVPEKGREVTEIDSKSEFAHRVMLTNVHRLMGGIAQAKRGRSIECRPALTILPLSPNHGIFGGDGLYGESKIGLETLLNRWQSESWHDYITVVGVSIGWTRGTGLMNENNILAEGIEKAGIRTFSSDEMAFNILGLLHPRMARVCEREPLYADFNGGLDTVANLATMASEIRLQISKKSDRLRASILDGQREKGLRSVVVKPKNDIVRKRAHQRFEYPKLPNPAQHQQDEGLSLLLDPTQVIVLTGFSEVGPWGNSRTRWEMEAMGEFSLEGCIEMAWIMGMIKFHSQPSDGKNAAWTGWVDSKTSERVEDYQVKEKYEGAILKHSGIRFIEPELFEGYDPEKKSLCREVIIDQDMAPFVASKEEAKHFKLQHGDKCEVYSTADGTWNVRLKAGASLYIPKALRFDRLVAGQIPSGWSAARYGVPQEIIEQVDPVTLYALIATVEALVSAGITDPYEIYQYIHVSELGNTAGGGEGGMLSNRKIFKSRFLDQPVQSDILQESFINTMPAWINLLLLSASGPIKTPVGACATAVQSLELGVECIQSGKAKVVIVGGYDDFQEESSYEFASMKATSSAVDELAKGREPGEMSRPAASSRSGFMESQGAGIQILMTADLALQMGCPIYGVVALTNTAMDKEGRSIPSPGQGILTTARSIRSPQSLRPRILDVNYRKSQLAKDLAQIKEWLNQELRVIQDSQDWLDCTKEREDMESLPKGFDPYEHQIIDLELEAKKRTKMAKKFWGLEFWKGDPRIAPLEGALAMFGLNIDDIGLASFHGTGTKANDLNESQVVDRQLSHLGRSKGNVLPCIFQKYLTGHPKGAAAAWMLNGALQSLATNIIPGNRNADNIDEALWKCSNLLYLNRSVQTSAIHAALLKSFGFGQVGGEALIIHPYHLFKALSPQEFEAYCKRREARQAITYGYMNEVLIGDRTMFQAKTMPPYSPSQEAKVYLNPLARASYDPKLSSWKFKETDQTAVTELKDVMLALAEATINPLSHGVGVDVQLISEINPANAVFIQRNFTELEIAYCMQKPDPQASLTGRWAAKEAVVKALCNYVTTCYPEKGLPWLEGSAASLKAVEVLADDASGAPIVDISSVNNLPPGLSVKVSISHSGSYAVAMATVAAAI